MALDPGTATILASTIAAGANVATSVGGAMRSLKKNKELAQYQSELAMNNWLTQQAYNTPEAQMARLREAGLNPHLMYGNGNFVNSANQAPETPDVAPVDFVDAGSRIGQSISQGVNSVIQARMINTDIKYKNVEITKMLDDLITSEQNRLVQLRELKLKVDENSREWTRLDQQERELQSRLKTYEKQREQIDSNIEAVDRQNEREDIRLNMEINREPYVLKDLMTSTGLKKAQAKQALEIAAKTSLEIENYPEYVKQVQASTKVSEQQARKIALDALIEECSHTFEIVHGFSVPKTLYETIVRGVDEFTRSSADASVEDVRKRIEEILDSRLSSR